MAKKPSKIAAPGVRKPAKASMPNTQPLPNGPMPEQPMPDVEIDAGIKAGPVPKAPPIAKAKVATPKIKTPAPTKVRSRQPRAARARSYGGRSW